MNLLNQTTIEQYQKEERTLILRRYKSAELRIGSLLKIMSEEKLSSPEKVEQLRYELAEHYKSSLFDKASTMGQIVHAHIEFLLDIN